MKKKTGAGIFYTDGQKVLLLKRATGTDHAHTWAIPGGGSRHGEAINKTAERESKEEIGMVHGASLGHICVTDDTQSFTVFVYSVDKHFVPRLNKEHSEFKWTPISDLKQLKLHPKFRASLPEYLKLVQKKFPKNFKEWIFFADLGI